MRLTNADLQRLHDIVVEHAERAAQAYLLAAKLSAELKRQRRATPRPASRKKKKTRKR